MPQSFYLVDADGTKELQIDDLGSLQAVFRDKDNNATEFDTAAAGTGYGYLISVMLEHHKIHEGIHYTTTDYDNDVDIAVPKYWHIKTPATGFMHMTWRVKSTLNGLVELFEAPTTTADGTSLTPRNNNRNSSSTATLQVFYDPTVTVDGTRLDVDTIGSDGTNPVGAEGGDMERVHEWILKQSASYLIKFTAETDNCRVNMHIAHYEVIGT